MNDLQELKDKLEMVEHAGLIEKTASTEWSSLDPGVQALIIAGIGSAIGGGLGYGITGNSRGAAIGAGLGGIAGGIGGVMGSKPLTPQEEFLKKLTKQIH